MVNKNVRTHDPVEAKKQREKAAQQQKINRLEHNKWFERRLRGEIPGLVKSVEEKED